MSPETGDLGGGLEAAELLMGLWHGGRGGEVDAGAVTVTGVGGDLGQGTLPPWLGLRVQSRPPLRDQRVLHTWPQEREDQRPCFNFPCSPTLKTSSSDLERKHVDAYPQAPWHSLVCITYSKEMSMERKSPPKVGSGGHVCFCPVSSTVCALSITNRNYCCHNIFLDDGAGFQTAFW